MALVLVVAGCTSIKAPDTPETVLPEIQQEAYLSRSESPQHFGFSTYPVRGGIGLRGAARLHPNHIATARMPSSGVPAIKLRGRSARNRINALLDVSSPTSWMEFTAAQEFDAVFLAFRSQNIPYRGGYNTGNVAAYAAVVSQLRIDRLFIENIPLYVRMATGSLGPLARGVRRPDIGTVFGYDILKQFAFIQFDFEAGIIRFSSSKSYTPSENLLMSTVKITNQPNFGLAVEGALFGEPSPVILDLAGDFHFARGDTRVATTRQISIGDLVFRQVPTLILPLNSSPPRAGRRLLQDYIITVCPQDEVVHFERIP